MAIFIATPICRVHSLAGSAVRFEPDSMSPAMPGHR